MADNDFIVDKAVLMNKEPYYAKYSPTTPSTPAMENFPCSPKYISAPARALAPLAPDVG
jgi:hypothetical protein